MRRVKTVLGLFLALTLLPIPLQAQRAHRQDEEVMNYRLSMAKLRKMLEVQRGLNAAQTRNPRLFDRVNQESEAVEKQKGRPLTVAEKVAIMERDPALQRAFTSAGGNARDWLLTMEAMGNAYVSIMAREGTVTGPPPATDAQKANVALLETNDAEWQKILEEWDRLTDAMTQ